MTNYSNEVQLEREIDTWDYFKKAARKCKELEFSERQLLYHIHLVYTDNIKGEL